MPETSVERVHRLAQAIHDSNDSGTVADLAHQLHEASAALAVEMSASWDRLQQENARLHQALNYAAEQFEVVATSAIMDYTWRNEVRKIADELERLRRG